MRSLNQWPSPNRADGDVYFFAFTHLVTACYDEEYLRLHDVVRGEMAASCESVLQSKLAGGNKIVAFASRKH